LAKERFIEVSTKTFTNAPQIDFMITYGLKYPVICCRAILILRVPIAKRRLFWFL